MALKTTVFEVALDNDRAEIAFGLRVAVVEYLRNRFRKKLAGAEDAGVDKMTAMQRFSLSYAGAARGYRLPKAIPASLVSWAGYVEYNDSVEWFPSAPRGTIGIFDKEAISTPPGNVALIKMGGVNFAGVFEGAIPSDVVEVRITVLDSGKYQATVVSGRPDDGSDMRVPMQSEPETQDA